MSSNAENKMYPTIRMRKTKKRVSAATKLQALVRGKLARRTATAKKQQKQVKGRSAYKSYLSSFTLDNTEKVGGFAGLDLLHSFQPQLEQSLKEHGGLKIHISSIGLYRKSVDPKDNDGKLSIALGLMKDYNKAPDDELQSFWHTTHIVQITNSTTIKKTLKELGESLIIRTTITPDKLASNSCHERTMPTNSL